MAITSYNTLKTAIVAWTHFDDLTSMLDEIIDLTESILNRELRLSEMETRATITASAEYVPKPTGALEFRNVQLNTSPVRILDYKTPSEMDRTNQGEGGHPRQYTIIGDEFQLYPVPTSSEIEVTYYKSITPLDDTNTTNFLLTSHPDIYLHGCLTQAYIYRKDMEAASVHGQQFERLIGELNRTSKRRKFSGSPMYVLAS